MESLQFTQVENNPDFTLLRSRNCSQEEVAARAALYRPVYNPYIKVHGRKPMDIQDIINSEQRILVKKHRDNSNAGKLRDYSSKEQALMSNLEADLDTITSQYYKIFTSNTFKESLIELQSPRHTVQARDPRDDLVTYCEYLRGLKKV